MSLTNSPRFNQPRSKHRLGRDVLFFVNGIRFQNLNGGEDSAALSCGVGDLQPLGSGGESLLSHLVQFGDRFFECNFTIEEQFSLLSFLLRGIGTVRLKLLDLLQRLQSQVGAPQLFEQREHVVSDAHIIRTQRGGLLQCGNRLVISKERRPRCAGFRHDPRFNPVEDQMGHAQDAIAFGNVRIVAQTSSRIANGRQCQARSHGERDVAAGDGHLQSMLSGLNTGWK